MFLNSLIKAVTFLHKQGLSHSALHWGNVAINWKTGEAKLYDAANFGRSFEEDWFGSQQSVGRGVFGILQVVIDACDAPDNVRDAWFSGMLNLFSAGRGTAKTDLHEEQLWKLDYNSFLMQRFSKTFPPFEGNGRRVERESWLQHIRQGLSKDIKQQLEAHLLEKTNMHHSETDGGLRGDLVESSVVQRLTPYVKEFAAASGGALERLKNFADNRDKYPMPRVGLPFKLSWKLSEKTKLATFSDEMTPPNQGEELELQRTIKGTIQAEEKIYEWTYTFSTRVSQKQ